MVTEEKLTNIEKYAHLNNIPIIQKEGIEFLTEFIQINNITKILEIGTAIAYSAIKMAIVNKNIQITTIEKDKERYTEALKNIQDLKLENQINIILDDANNIELEDKYDLIFIDAAKAQNQKFFLKFQNNLQKKGYIITDNINFHGLVQKELTEIKSKNLKALVRKIKNYIEFLQTNEEYVTIFHQLGDGIAVSKRKVE